MRNRDVLDLAVQHVQAHMPLGPVPGVPDLRLHRATPQSQLSELIALVAAGDAPPYWAYSWAGGLALAAHLRAHPEIVAGQRVLDIGAGSGLVGIVAAQMRARSVLTADTDALARLIIPLNAAANGVEVRVTGRDFLTEQQGPLAHGCNVILAGDLFYDADLAKRALATLTKEAKAGRTVLIGDPGRKTLPLDRLEIVAEYDVTDMGLPPTAPLVRGLVLKPTLD